jgi:hypothetical protein
MNAQMKATWRKMCGAALLWVALAALVYIPTSDGGVKSVIVASIGFACFAAGLGLFSDGMAREIVEQTQRK